MTVDLVKKHPNFAFAFVLISLIALQYAPRVIQGEAILGHDTVWQFEPWYRFGWESIRSEDWPFWNPYTFSGNPFLANPQTSLFYPPNWVLLLFPSPTTIELIAVAHIFFLGLFTFWLGKELGLLPYPAAVSGLVLAFSEYSAARMWAGHIDVLATATWLPLLFLVMRRLAKQQNLADLLKGIFCTAMILLAGFPQVAYFIFFAAAFFGVFLLIAEVGGKRKLSVLVYYLLMVLGGLALSLVQLLPTYEMLRASSRGSGVGFDFATASSFPPWYLITTLAPDFFGTQANLSLESLTYLGVYLHEGPIYVGAIALLLAIFAVWIGRRDKSILFFTFLGGTFLVLSMGKYIPIYRFLFDFVPGYSRFRVPAHHLVITIFCLSLLAGWGVQLLYQRRAKSALAYKFALFVMVMLELLVVLGFALQGPFLKFVADGIANGSISWSFKESIPVDLQVQGVEFLYHNALLSLWLPSLLLLSFCLWWMILFRHHRLETVSRITLVVLAVGGLLVFDFQLGLANTDWTYYRPQSFSPILQQIFQQQDKRFRVLLMEGEFDSPTSDNVNAFGLEDHVEILNGYDPVILAGYDRYVALLTGKDEIESTGHQMFTSLARPELLSLLNVKYVVSGKSLAEDLNNLKLLEHDDNTWLYENTQVRPRAYLVETDKATLVKDETAAFKQLETGFGPDSTIIESNSPILITAGDVTSLTTNNSVTITDYKNNYVTLSVRASTPGYLVLSDIYYPGWTAYVDGVQQDVLRANAIFRAIPVGPGDHLVEFRFVPTTLIWGSLISGATLLVLCLLLVRVLRRQLSANRHPFSPRENAEKQAIKI